MKKIPVAGPSITDLEISYVTDAVKTAWFDNHAVYHNRFEKAFAEAIGVKFAMALPSCTSALHLALAALGVGPGDEVIVPDATWIASSAPITYVGADPVFVDIDRNTWCMDAQAFEQAITAKTKAAIVVDLYGSMPDWDALQKIADKHEIALIEDAAEATGSQYNGKMAGSFGQVATFSFHGSKTLTTGEGGMLVTNDKVLYDKVQFLRDHGRPAGDRLFQNTQVAYKYKMSAMQAAIGLAQTERMDELVNLKRQIFNWYKDALAGHPHITLNHEPNNVKNSYWMITAIIDPSLGIKKVPLMEEMSKANIDTRPFFHPLSSLDAYKELPAAKKAQEQNTVAYSVTPHGINLPSGAQLDREAVKRVCNELIKAIDTLKNKRSVKA